MKTTQPYFNYVAIFIVVSMFVPFAGRCQTWSTGGNTITSSADYVGGNTSSTTDFLLKMRANYNLRFYTNDIEKMRIMNTGEVGIGTTSPSSWLTVNTSGTGETFRTSVPSGYDSYWRIFQGTTEYGRIVHFNSGPSLYLYASRGALKLASGNSTGTTNYSSFQIFGGNGSNAGYIGIGDFTILNPTRQLDIYDPSNPQLRLSYNAGTTGSPAGSTIYTDFQQLSTGNLNINPMNGSTPAGVGIGTTSPTFKLEVLGSTQDVFKSDVGSSLNSYWRMFSQGTEYGRFYHLYGGGTAKEFYVTAPYGNLRLGSGLSGTVISALEITGATSTNADGNVLVGDFSSFTGSARLHIKGNGYASLLKVENSTQTTPALTIDETEHWLAQSRDNSGSVFTHGAFDFEFTPTNPYSTSEGMYLKAEGAASIDMIGSNILAHNTYSSKAIAEGIRILSYADNAYSSIGINSTAYTPTNGSKSYGGYFTSYGTGTSNIETYGLYSYASAGNKNYGLWASADFPIGIDRLDYGVYGQAYSGFLNVGVRGYASDQNNFTPVAIFGVQGEAEDLSGSGSNFYGVWGKAPSQCVTSGGSTTCTGAAGFFVGDVYATGNIYSSSDSMFKDQITPVNNASSILSNIAAKQFIFKQSNYPSFNLPSGTHYGFIAQEVEHILPNLVKQMTNPSERDSLGNILVPAIPYKAVNYEEFIPLLVAGFNEQKHIVDSLLTLIAANPIHPRVVNPNLIPPANSQRIELNNNQGVILNQNDPNPFSESTTISYYIPATVKDAKILFSDNKGSVLRTAKIDSRGDGTLEVYASELSSGIYTYTLICDGKVIESKKMMKTN